jgi:uncharacterized protein (TIGR00255 family)
MIRSMTGFGAADGPFGGWQLVAEVRTVNHRFFSPALKLPAECARWEAEVREALRSRVSRGHVTLSVRLVRPDEGPVAIDPVRFAAAVAQLRALQQAHALEGGVDLATVLRMPEVIQSGREESGGTVGDLLAVVEQATAGLARSRAEEGARLAAVLAQRLAVLEEALGRIAARAPERLVAHRDRLRCAVRELADGVVVDPQRLAQEVALLADRLDVSEEVDRFRSHLVACRQALGTGYGEPVGKRLGFLLQEMVREANTIGSKAADAPILHDVVQLKEELERIREQVENLE